VSSVLPGYDMAGVVVIQHQGEEPDGRRRGVQPHHT
jgi:hypothetical protein